MNKEQIDYYVWKYQAKMWGSRLRTAKEWIEGIGSISKDEQSEVLKRLKKIQGAIV